MQRLQETLKAQPRVLLANASAKWLIVAAVGAAAVLVIVSFFQSPSSAETALVQLVIVATGLAGGYVEGVKAGSEAEKAVREAHGRSAFHRVVSLYEGLGAIGVSIEGRRVVLSSQVDPESQTNEWVSVEAALDLLATHVQSQVNTANDAILDWRDIVPEEVAALEERLLSSASPRIEASVR